VHPAILRLKLRTSFLKNMVEPYAGEASQVTRAADPPTPYADDYEVTSLNA
jgi:hypothetical protein